jgi:DNA polymerase-4
VKLRFDDFRIVTRVVTADTWIRDAATIRHWAGYALKKAPLGQKLRLLGVRAGNLRSADSNSTPRHDIGHEERSQLTLGLF